MLVRRFGENGSREEDEVPDMENLMWMDEHLQRLLKLKLKDSLKSDSALKKSMPRYEWEAAWTYHDAMVKTISATFEKVIGDAPYNDHFEDDS